MVLLHRFITSKIRAYSSFRMKQVMKKPEPRYQRSTLRPCILLWEEGAAQLDTTIPLAEESD